MTLKIGLIGDVHATPAPVREAFGIFAHDGIQTILCTGDIAGYGNQLEETIALLQESGCRAILGNHDVWRLGDVELKAAAEGPSEAYLCTLPMRFEMTIAGKRLVMIHASPPGSLMDGIKLLDEEGAMIPEQRDFWTTYLQPFPIDVLVVGHTHQVFAEWLGNKLVINPGSTKFNHTCAILTLPEMAVEFLALGGRAPVFSWNWGLFGLED